MLPVPEDPHTAGHSACSKQSCSALALLHAGGVRRSLPVLCVTLALAPLRLLSGPVLEAARAWGAWREHMAESAADPQVGLDSQDLAQLMTQRQRDRVSACERVLWWLTHFSLKPS